MRYVMLFVLSNLHIMQNNKEILFTNTVLSIETKCRIDKNRVDFHWFMEALTFVNIHHHFDPHDASYKLL